MIAVAAQAGGQRGLLGRATGELWRLHRDSTRATRTPAGHRPGGRPWPSADVSPALYGHHLSRRCPDASASPWTGFVQLAGLGASCLGLLVLTHAQDAAKHLFRVLSQGGGWHTHGRTHAVEAPRGTHLAHFPGGAVLH